MFSPKEKEKKVFSDTELPKLFDYLDESEENEAIVINSDDGREFLIMPFQRYKNFYEPMIPKEKVLTVDDFCS